jgi:hypothetical protein
MAVPPIRVPPVEAGTLRQASDEVEPYHRTYTTLLRSSGETLLRVLEPSHAAMNSSLHLLAYDMETPRPQRVPVTAMTSSAPPVGGCAPMSDVVGVCSEVRWP